MLRVFVCVLSVAASMQTETTTPCASGFLATPCPPALATSTTTPSAPSRVASTVSTTPLPCRTSASPVDGLAISGAHVNLAQESVEVAPVSTVTATPVVAIDTTRTSTPVPCYSTSLKPCPTLASTMTTTPCVPMDALAIAGARDTVGAALLTSGEVVASTATTTPLPCPTSVTPCGALAIAGAHVDLDKASLPHSTSTTTPSIFNLVPETTKTTTPIPCSTSSQKPCPVIASTLTTTPCALAQVGALAIAGSRDSPEIASSASDGMVVSTATTTPSPCPTTVSPCGALAIAGAHVELVRAYGKVSSPWSTVTTTPCVAIDASKARVTYPCHLTTTTMLSTTTVVTSTTTTTVTTTTTITSATMSTSMTTTTTITTIKTVADDSNTTNGGVLKSVGGLAISGASMSAKIVSSKGHSISHAKASLRRKERGTTHSIRSDSDVSLLPFLGLALLLLCIVIPCWYCCHRSNRKLSSAPPKVTEEAPLLSREVIDVNKLETVLESPREAAPLVSSSRIGEESGDAQGVASGAILNKRETSLDSVRSHVDDVAPTEFRSSTELVAPDVAQVSEQETLAAEAMVDMPDTTISSLQPSASPSRQREIPLVGEAPKNTGCCACRGRH
eukprot:CAMPEP_0169109202 /NCGR_PEP_ID=MMETSP1015-20121227/25839_1 /TAXON_ID=342587 /ORGANISM="Karlodinium micrum, Strain CCMP2283" /LENGTH=618 /DNA_ID=CAMNT_0009170883 /DNA_START=79 /DNA_END=1935 /DNA_ORIENTATION=+